MHSTNLLTYLLVLFILHTAELNTERVLRNLCVIDMNDVPTPAAKLVSCRYIILY